MDITKQSALTETGYQGLNIFSGVTQEEVKRELNFPTSVKTFKSMSYHPSINAPLTLYHTLASKVKWRFIPPADATEEEKKQCEAVASMMGDMDTTWNDFISDVLSAQIYGFSVHEKVYRKRTPAKGSKFSDGYYGWKKLAIRAQDTIKEFKFDKTGNEVTHVVQDITAIANTEMRFAKRGDMEVTIPRNKFLLFRVGKHRGDPFGKSPLRDAYIGWRYLTAIEEIEAHGIAKDLTGLPVLYLPPQYLATDASPEQVAIRQYYENAMRNLQVNNQSSMILPMAYDPETRQPLFKLELLALDGKKALSTEKAKDYYKTMIFTTLFADLLILGQGNTGSFALGQLKNSLTGSYAETLLQNIAETLNHDLVRQTYELNGWDASRAGTFDFEGLDSIDLETLSKAVQRFGATGYLPKTLDVVNRVLSSVGVDELPENTKVEDVLPDATTRSGDGMQQGMNSGTGNADGSSGNASDMNSNNAS